MSLPWGGIEVEIGSDGDDPEWVNGYVANLEEIGYREQKAWIIFTNWIRVATGAVETLEAEWIRPQTSIPELPGSNPSQSVVPLSTHFILIA